MLADVPSAYDQFVLELGQKVLIKDFLEEADNFNKSINVRWTLLHQ